MNFKVLSRQNVTSDEENEESEETEKSEDMEEED